MSGDQLVHLLKQSSAPADSRPFLYGHIASYDPKLHRVRCVIPSMTDQDGKPTLSPWMPMATMSAGSGFGVQVIYHGGATVDNPTAGEQVVIGMFDRQRGVAAVIGTFYHGAEPTPANNLPTQQDGYSGGASQTAPGDVIIAAPPTADGGANTFIRLRQSGAIEIWSAGAVTADIKGSLTATLNTGDLNVEVKQGNATVQAISGVVNIIGSAIKLSKASADALFTLCTSKFQTVFNAHIHGDSPPPTPTAGPDTMTTIVTAE